jgi:uncharacterized protein YdaU (DUF1376 family)
MSDIQKDPAFLFYSKDFYEGTRTMLPQERACLIDLMIYQHQNGIIPDDIPRLQMYCSGIDEATLKATLKAKFKQEPAGWKNKKLQKIIGDRKDFIKKQSVNGKIGQFIKKSKAILQQAQYEQLLAWLNSFQQDEKLNIILDFETKHEGNLQAMLEAMFKHLAIVNENENVIENVIDKNNKVLVDEKLNYQSIIDFFNQTCTSLPKVQAITEGRKKAIKARINEYGLATVYNVFKLAAASDRLNGKNKDNWKADFDWIMTPTYFPKIMENCYANRQPQFQNGNAYEKPGRIEKLMKIEQEIQNQ